MAAVAIMKWFSKFKNMCEVQRQWRCEFETQPQTQLTISRTWDKFGPHGTVQDMHKK
jgi:hypothetical protein